MFRYVALGDSITAGDGATSPSLAYPSLLVQKVQQHKRGATGEVLAEPGWTSAALTSAFLENSPFYVSTASAVSIWVGGDDIAYAGISVLRGAPKSTVAASIKTFGKQVGTLVTAIRSISRANIILCTQYNPFPNSPLAVEAIQALNAATMTVGSALGVTIAPVHTWFEGQQSRLIRGYKTGRLEDVLTQPTLPIHPNNQGHLWVSNHLYPMLV